MTELGTHFEREDLGGGRFRHIQHMRPIAYNDGGVLKRIDYNWADGDVNFPHAITKSGMMVYTTGDGMRRICPTHEIDRYLEIGAPYIKPGGIWQKVNLGAATRSGNKVSWQTTNADVNVLFAGHYVKLLIELKNGWQPPGGRVAFPVGLNGLTRQGGVLLRDGVPVMHMRAPHMEDAANPMDVRPIATDFVQVAGQWYALLTLPSLTGMIRPVVDPTLTLQPDAADGKDASILDAASNYNSGAHTTILLGEQTGGDQITRSLMQFSLTQLPDRAVITSAQLGLYYVASYSSNARTTRVYRLLRTWVEGTRAVVDDTPATGVTWLRYDLTNTWASPGAFGVTDCEQVAIGSHDFSATETLNEFKYIVLTPATKAAMDLGQGWLLKMDTELDDRLDFASSDHATAAFRPQLTIEYTLSGRAMKGLLNRSIL